MFHLLYQYKENGNVDHKTHKFLKSTSRPYLSSQTMQRGLRSALFPPMRPCVCMYAYMRYVSKRPKDQRVVHFFVKHKCSIGGASDDIDS